MILNNFKHFIIQLSSKSFKYFIGKWVIYFIVLLNEKKDKIKIRTSIVDLFTTKKYIIFQNF